MSSRECFQDGPLASRVHRDVHRVQIAPMLDVSYPDFRMFMRTLTRRSQIWSEMVVDKVLIYNSDNTTVLDEHLSHRRAEDPMVLQLGGSDPALLAKATEVVYRYGYEEVNLNAGCPSCRVAGLGEFGAALMKKPDVIVQCLEAMSAAAPIKVSLKTRLGVDDYDTKEYFSGLVDSIQAARVSPNAHFSLVVHARKAWLKGLSPAQNRSVPPLDYQRAFDVCGVRSDLKWYMNGGIDTLDLAADLFRRGPSNMEGVMMGRAAMNTPCIFSNVDTMFYGADTNPASASSRRLILEAYTDYLHDKYSIERDRSVFSSGEIFNAMKPVLGVFHGTKNARKWRQRLDVIGRDHVLRKELGIAGSIQEAVKDMDPDVLDEWLVSSR